MIKFKLDRTFANDHPFTLNVEGSAHQGIFICIYGPSGAGKTTFLRLMAGLEKPDHGYIEINDKKWLDTENAISVPVNKRKLGFIFQDYALFPNMSVLENLQFASESKNSKKDIDSLIEILQLQNLLTRKPDSLSGGEKQRVALARSMVRRPDVLFLDEPLAALDWNMKHKIQDLLLEIHKEMKPNIFMVSHDISEIFKMADEVWQMTNGRFIKKGSPEAIFSEHYVSGKFQITGDIIDISKKDVVFVISVLSAKNIIKVVATDDDVKDLKIGDKVIVASKAFNPAIFKLNK